MTESGAEAYRLGREYQMLPIPMVEENCVEIPAGPVIFVVEARSLTEKAIVANATHRGVPDGNDSYHDIGDGGASLHVLGADDRLEWLRFDCFDHEPHYHYIRNDTQSNAVVRIDDVVEDDPLAWTLARVRDRLPEMLEHTGSAELADRVRAAHPEVIRGWERLREVMEGARERSVALRRAAGVSVSGA